MARRVERFTAGTDACGIRAAVTGGTSGLGLANQRIGPSTPLRIVNAILSGVHEPGTSHRQLLRAFADDTTLARMQEEVLARDYRTHEFGDSVLIEAMISHARRPADPITSFAEG